MRVRAYVLIAACVLGAACRGSREPDAYWGQVDGLYLQASQVFTDGYANPTGDSVTRLQALREQISALPHPAAANRFHELLVAELDDGIAVLSAMRDHDAPRADQANQKLREMQKQVQDERQRVAPHAART
jgi:uncharacterized protein YceH (UPF0502 family)